MKSKVNGSFLVLIASAILAIGISWGAMTVHAHDDYISRAEIEQIVLRLDTEITRLHEEINRLYDLK